MKLESGRGFDQQDVTTLVAHLGLRTVEEGTGIHARLFPQSRKGGRAREMMEAALKAMSPGAKDRTVIGQKTNG